MCAKYMNDNVLPASAFSSMEGRKPRSDLLAVALEASYLRFTRIEHLVCSSKTMLDALLARAAMVYSRLKETARREENIGLRGGKAEPCREAVLEELLRGVEDIYRYCQTLHGPALGRVARRPCRPEDAQTNLERSEPTKLSRTHTSSHSFDFEMLTDQKMELADSHPLTDSTFGISPRFAASCGRPRLPPGGRSIQVSSMQVESARKCLKQLTESSERPSAVGEEALFRRKPAHQLFDADEEYVESGHHAQQRLPRGRKPSLGTRTPVFSPMRPSLNSNCWMFGFRRNPPRRQLNQPAERGRSRNAVCNFSLRDLPGTFAQQLGPLNPRQE